MMDLDHVFQYHSHTTEQQESYHALREAAKAFAAAIQNHCPAGADQSAALRKVREAVMTANAAVALDGRLDVEGPSELVPFAKPD